MKGARAGQADSRLREACQICEYPYPLLADITVGLIGSDFDKEIVLLANTPAGEQLVDGLGLPEARADGRQAAIDKLVAERVKRRDEVFQADPGGNQGAGEADLRLCAVHRLPQLPGYVPGVLLPGVRL